MFTISHTYALRGILASLGKHARGKEEPVATASRRHGGMVLARIAILVVLACGVLLQGGPATPYWLAGDTFQEDSANPGASTSGGPVYSHGGTVMHGYTAYLIFWLPKGHLYEPEGNDQRFARLIVRYFQDVSETSFLKITTQYGDASGAPNDKVSLGGIVVDRVDPYPRAGTTRQPLKDSDIQAEIKRVIRVKGWTPSPSREYFVFTGYGIQSCQDKNDCSFPTANDGFYAGYHLYFVDPQTGEPVIYATLPDIADTLPDSGAMQDGSKLSPNGDWIADSEISVMSHEQFESITDPFLRAWGDKSGQEIADKCQELYGTVNQFGADVLLHGDPYVVQEEWSNAAGGCTLSR